MYGELTDKETVSRLEYTLENQQQDQFEVLLYKKNSKYLLYVIFISINYLYLEQSTIIYFYIYSYFF